MYIYIYICIYCIRVQRDEIGVMEKNMATNYRLRFKGLRDTTPVVENQTEKTL